MKILKVDKFQSQKRNTSSHPPEKTRTTPSSKLRKTDWQALLQHDRITGKLDLKSKAVIREPRCVKRLLEGKMIDPYGKLTAAAKEKCAAIIRKFQHPQSRSEAFAAFPKSEKKPKPTEKKGDKLTASDWAVLMNYDRKSGNLLKYDPKTGRLDNASRAILKAPSTIQRFIDNNMISPGGWLTPKARKACARIRKKSKKQTTNGYFEPQANFKTEPKSLSERRMKLYSAGESHDISASGRETDSLLANWPKDENLQTFFENLAYTGRSHRGRGA